MSYQGDQGFRSIGEDVNINPFYLSGSVNSGMLIGNIVFNGLNFWHGIG